MTSLSQPLRLPQAQRAALERQDALAAQAPLRLGGDPNILFVHVRHAARLLKDRQAPSPCANAMGHIQSLFDSSIPPAANAGLACRQGCAHCCSQPVMVYAPEAFALARHIRERPDVAQRLRRNVPPLPRLRLAPGTSQECPLLEDAACSVYAPRPLSCRSYVSLNADDCLGAFRHFAPSNIRAPQIYHSLRNTCRMMMMTAIMAAGLKPHAYELVTVLDRILGEDNAEKHWLRGEDPLAGMEIPGMEIPPMIAAEAERILAAVTPAL